MRWEVTVPGQGGRGDGRTVAVDADNWRAAIAAALESLGEPAAWVRGWAADVRDGGTVVARCPRTRLIVTARSLDHVAPPPIAPVRPPYLVPGAASFSGASLPPAGASGRPSAPPPAARHSVPPVLPQHHVFFARDENPDGGSALCYRERLIAVPAGVGRDGINALLMSYYEGLRSELEDRDEAKYVNVAVFDHAFSARAERPALAALSWKSWRSEVPEVIYPVDQLAALPAQQQAPQAPQAEPPAAPVHAAR
ncbi:MAG: hypothetical protein QME96_08695, partial [Myxococcota bacterium]|nr:hypothetical protein [Myxococcota bacterium]